MGQQRLRMVVGLGNPGETYSRTRHNTGFMVIDALSDAYTIPLVKTKHDAIFGRGIIDGMDVLLAKPMTYMNRSGFPVQRLARYFRILCEDLLVVHDDIDLAIGRLRIKEKGGDAGHKGIRSIMRAFGSGNFARLRVGIGRGDADTSVSDHVLSAFRAEEQETMNIIIETARNAVVTILNKGVAEGMNRFNNTTITI